MPCLQNLALAYNKKKRNLKRNVLNLKASDLQLGFQQVVLTFKLSFVQIQHIYYAH